VLVYFFSVALALDRFCWRRSALLLFIVGATALTIHGEMNFSCTGFAIQGTSIICESMKLTLQSYALSVTGKRLDAFTYVTLVAPLVILVLSVLVSILCCLGQGVPKALQMPTLGEVLEYKWLLVASGCLAFGMNVSHAAFIKQSSAITFILTGVLLKDVLIVGAGAAFMGAQLSSMQVLGFSMQLLGILAWSLLKLDLKSDSESFLSSYLTRALSLAGGCPIIATPVGPSAPGLTSKTWAFPRVNSESSTVAPSTELTEDWEQLLEDGCPDESARELLAEAQ
jgi:hypothetical protein